MGIWGIYARIKMTYFKGRAEVTILYIGGIGLMVILAFWDKRFAEFTTFDETP